MIDELRWSFKADSERLSKRAAEKAISNLALYNSFMCENYDDEEKKESLKFFKMCKKEFDALFAETIVKMEGGAFDGIFEDGLR